MQTNTIIRLLRFGSSLGPIECLLAYILPAGFVLSNATDLQQLLIRNAACQLCIFTFLVQIPLAITKKMAYVDIGWPLGLLILGLNGMYFGQGAMLRRYTVCGCMILHGGRMFLGALALFYPYTFKDGDLSRYQYAKHRWVVHEGLPERLWPIKAQLDTLTQCFANCLILACPILLAATNPEPSLHILEIAGIFLWITAWAFENIADGQKIMFLQECKSLAKEKISSEDKLEIKNGVLGFYPFDSKKYWLWTRCRHPNYFFEWVSWIGFATIGLGNVVTKDRWLRGGEGLFMSALLTLTLVLMVRFFYDCLLYWTGSAPAEQQSVRKRPLYKSYQESTRVFFPFPMPDWIVSHHRTPGWPLCEIETTDSCKGTVSIETNQAKTKKNK